ncbi:MarR family transcriptional regulator [Streptomyces sp. NBC_01565]|uniref:MarR family transcriptional regulator n=1 Tax=unclassified Streptomyces TaxID=2593676 RepID=UPI00224F1733|nr:MarR family transcriptional regulator [Streptomyces sp. NBC_01565]MCX4544190.1 MarR family transcriptional regulator [Streptomyces sp. NBC_01565]
MTITQHPQDRIAAQPIGYWTRETANLVIGALRTALAEENLTQPHWWILNHIAASPDTWQRTTLTEKLAPYDDQNTDFNAVYDDLTTRNWLTETNGALTLTEAGEAGRQRAHTRNAKVHTRMREGIDDTTYAATINTLRRLTANLGGNSELP